MRTVGVDLAAEPTKTAIAVIDWWPGGARVDVVEMPADDDAVVRHASQADKVGIDCPLGWPDRFVEFVQAHRDNTADVAREVVGSTWRRSLAYRRTDELVRAGWGLNPLSVAADRIGLTAMRAARLQVLLGQGGHDVDRAGSGLIVEVYPAVALKTWGLAYRSYKGRDSLVALNNLVDRLRTAAPWLEFGASEQVMRVSDDAFDAVIAALIARAVAQGRATTPSKNDEATARTEGWIAVPTCDIGDLREPS